MAIGMLALLITPVKEHTPRTVVIAWLTVGVILTIVEGVVDLRRKRPRRRMLELAILSFALTVVFAVMACVVYLDGALEWGYMVAFAVVSAIFSVWSFLRWRRLKADAEAYLAILKVKRLNMLKKRRL